MRERLLLVLLLVVIGAGWGITQPLAKIAVSDGYRQFGLVFWQLAIGAVLLGLVVAATGRRLVVSRAALAMCVVIALIGTVLPNSASYQAAVHLPAGILSVLLSLVPMLAFPMALALGVERFRPSRLAGLSLGLAGVLVIALPEASLPERAMVAWIPVALVAPAFYALEGNVVARWGTGGLDPVELLFGASVIGAILALPLALGSGQWIDPRPPWGAPDAALALSASVHALVYTGYVWLVGRAGPVFAVQVSYLVTGFGVLWSIGLLSERYSGGVWLALGLMFLGLFLVQPRPRAAALVAPAPPGHDAR